MSLASSAKRAIDGNLNWAELLSRVSHCDFYLSNIQGGCFGTTRLGQRHAYLRFDHIFDGISRVYFLFGQV
jgi:hypothetical protein